MEEYREARGLCAYLRVHPPVRASAQRKKWEQEKQAKDAEVQEAGASANASAAAPGAASAASGGAASSSSGGAAASSSGAAGSGAPAASSSSGSAPAAPVSSAVACALAAGPMPCARRVHILPVERSPDANDQRRLELLAPKLRELRNSKAPIQTGLLITSSGHDFVVVKSDPDVSVLGMETDYFVEGDPVRTFEKVQFICLWDFQSANVGSDPSVLFNDYISPHFKELADGDEALGNIVAIGDTMKIKDMEFQ
ncbi:unnamed protein product, partial [Prorocentrum cordatum]